MPWVITMSHSVSISGPDRPCVITMPHCVSIIGPDRPGVITMSHDVSVHHLNRQAMCHYNVTLFFHQWPRQAMHHYNVTFCVHQWTDRPYVITMSHPVSISGPKVLCHYNVTLCPSVAQTGPVSLQCHILHPSVAQAGPTMTTAQSKQCLLLGASGQILVDKAESTDGQNQLTKSLRGTQSLIDLEPDM